MYSVTLVILLIILITCKFPWVSYITVTLSVKSDTFIFSFQIIIPFISLWHCQDLGSMWNRGSYITYQFISFYHCYVFNLRGDSFNPYIGLLDIVLFLFLVDLLKDIAFYFYFYENFQPLLNVQFCQIIFLNLLKLSYKWSFSFLSLYIVMHFSGWCLKFYIFQIVS